MTVPLFDMEAQYEEWQQDGFIRYGMRHKQTTKRHGITRFVQPRGVITEFSSKFGNTHGLYIKIADANQANVHLYKDG